MNAFTVIPKRQRLRLKSQYLRDLCACWFMTTAADCNPRSVQKQSDSTGVLAECVSGRKISARDSIFGAGQVRGQKMSVAVPLGTVAQQQP